MEHKISDQEQVEKKEPGAKPDETKDASSQAALEIERKFLISSLPNNLNDYTHKEIAQGYIVISEDGTEVRLRRKGNKHYMTVKKGSGKMRQESEVEISEDQYEKLWGMTAGRRLEKTRYEITHLAHTIELDIYHGALAGLITAEVEFKNETDSNKFSPPDWFGGEVTEDKAYKNQSLATKGLPEKNK